MPGLEYRDYLSYEGDEDWFFFEMASLHSIEAWLTVPQGCDYELYLYDAALSLKGRSATGAQVEFIHTEPLPPGRYYFRVLGARGGSLSFWSATQPYILKAQFPVATPTLTPTSTPTRTPTATPSSAWLSWVDREEALALGPSGRQVAVLYGNIALPARLSASLTGPAVFGDGSQAMTSDVRASSGSWSVELRRAPGAQAGDGFLLDIGVGGLRLERRGVIAWAVYLPALLKQHRAQGGALERDVGVRALPTRTEVPLPSAGRAR